MTSKKLRPASVQYMREKRKPTNEIKAASQKREKFWKKAVWIQKKRANMVLDRKKQTSQEYIYVKTNTHLYRA